MIDGSCTFAPSRFRRIHFLTDLQAPTSSAAIDNPSSNQASSWIRIQRILLEKFPIYKP